MLLVLLSWLNFFLCTGATIICCAVGLYYLTELIEEYTVLTRRILGYLLWVEIALHVALLLFEDLPWSMLLFGLFAHVVYSSLLPGFPSFQFLSIGFIGSLACIIGLHVVAFNHFSSVYYPFDQVMAYFVICIWLVPFILLVSLSANEFVLPQTIPTSSNGENMSGNDGSPFSLYHDKPSGVDFVSSYFKGKRRGLYYFLSTIKDNYLPQRRSGKGY